MIDNNTQLFINQHLKDDTRQLALKHNPLNVDIKLALSQISAYQSTIKKIPSWATYNGLIFPKHLSLEQASSEVTAIFKTNLIGKLTNRDDLKIVDLTGGFGIDSYFLSKLSSESHYVELDYDLCEIAKHNFQLFGSNIIVHNNSAEEFLKNSLHTTFDLIYIDPARRGKMGEKLYSISNCTPNIVQLQSDMFNLSNTILAKLSPMLDISLAIKELKHVSQVYVVSVANECKELLLLMQKDIDNQIVEPIINAINIDTKGNISDIVKNTYTNENNLSIVPTSKIGTYLYEPYSSILKSGLFKTISQQYNINKLHISSHLYTSDSLVNDFPGRKFQVNEIYDFNKKEIKMLSTKLKQSNITARNFPLSVDNLRKKLKLKEGSKNYIFATTLANEEKKLILCESIV